MQRLSAADLSMLDPYSRRQPGVGLSDIFPTRTDGLCACGCGEKLKGRRTRWANQGCSDAAAALYFVRTGASATIRGLIYRRDHGRCAVCGCACGVRLQGPMPFRERFFTLRRTWEADHILPVEEGGGGCGLENFQILCDSCHKLKTASKAGERATRRRADVTQVALEL